MITVKTILAPSQKIEDKEPENKGKSKPKKIQTPKSAEKPIQETATYSTIIVVDGKYISLSITKYLGYQKPFNLDHKIAPPKDVDLFEDLFYWPLEEFTVGALNKLAYKRMVETDFHYQSKLLYELQWEVIDIEIQGNKLFLGNKETVYLAAIPPNDSDEPRCDYILDDRTYKYGCKPGEFRGRALEIIVNN